jgi:hypothetical protein
VKLAVSPASLLAARQGKNYAAIAAGKPAG